MNKYIFEYNRGKKSFLDRDDKFLQDTREWFSVKMKPIPSWAIIFDWFDTNTTGRIALNNNIPAEFRFENKQDALLFKVSW